LKTNKPILL